MEIEKIKSSLNTGFSLMDTCKFHARTLEDVEMLSRFASGMFGNPARVQSGLYELLLNGLEHGCLGIGYMLKTKLVAAGEWEREVKRRLSLPENRGKRVELILARKDSAVYAVVTDPGTGFDWKPWIQADPARVSGRGILKAKSVSFDCIRYLGRGNQVAAHCGDLTDLAW